MIMATCNNTDRKTDVDPVKAFVQGMSRQVNADDVNRMVALQQHMLSRFEKTNEMLLNFNHLSESRFAMTQLEFRKHIHLLVETKKDLDSVFKRIRILKEKLRIRYPQAFTVCDRVHHVPDDESLEEQDETHTAAATAVGSTVTATDAIQPVVAVRASKTVTDVTVCETPTAIDISNPVGAAQSDVE